MPRRRYTHRAPCVPGCSKLGFFEYSTQREYAAHQTSLRTRPWRCTRHTAPDEVLSTENPTRTFTLVATPGEGLLSDELFWKAEGADRLDGGFVHGPGFKAYASDFPAGTRMTVTVQVQPPVEVLADARTEEHLDATAEETPQGVPEVPEECEAWACDGQGWSHQGTSYQSGERELQYAPCGRRCGRVLESDSGTS